MSAHPLARSFARLSLLRQFAVLMGAILVLGMLAFWLLGSTTLQSHALERARAIALMADAIGSWSSQYRGVWVFSDPTDPGAPVGESLDHRQARAAEPVASDAGSGSSTAPLGVVNIARTAGTFHRKVPSAVQRELSDMLSRLSSGDRVRVTNEPPLDARNAPNRFEQVAIARLRSSDAARDEYFETSDGRLLYARRITARADCVRCHVASEATPVGVKARFGSSPGWGGVREGAFGGIVSVSVPLVPATANDIGVGLGGMGAWTFLIAWATVFTVLLWWLQRRVIRLATSLDMYAQCLLHAKDDVRASRVIVDADEMASANELHKLSMALKAMHRALRAAYTQSP